MLRKQATKYIVTYTLMSLTFWVLKKQFLKNI